MRVLIATSYLYNPDWSEFTRNKTGFGIMLSNIVNSVSHEADVCFISHVITSGHGKIVVRHSWKDVILGANPKDWFCGIMQFLKYHQSLKDRSRYAYYWVNRGFVRKKIREFKPDVVHIHGIGQGILPYIEVCKELGVPFVVTLHGLIGLDESVIAPKWDKELERTFLIDSDKKGILVTVISSGMKKRIEENYLHHEAKSIFVVCNGSKVPFSPEVIAQKELNLHSSFGLRENEKVVVAIGTIGERKNQVQIVRSFATGLINTPCHLFICGTDCTNGAIQKLIVESGLEKKVHLLGFVPQETISKILDEADLNVLASKDEGFGLSIIEAFSHGVPSVTFSDFDAVPDLYSCDSMITVTERTDNALALAIESALGKTWNSDVIRDYAKRFDLDRMAEAYFEHYKSALLKPDGGGWGNPTIAMTCDFLHMMKKRGYKIVSYVGNISDNKNQFEFVQIMNELKGQKVVAVLAGSVDDQRIPDFIAENQLQESVILIGFCNELDSIWENVDLNVLLSKNDGFGLSIIEAGMRGVPSVLYRDLDSSTDVEGYGVLLVDRHDAKVEWNRILTEPSCYERRKTMTRFAFFSLESMGKAYVKVFQYALRNNYGSR